MLGEAIIGLSNTIRKVDPDQRFSAVGVITLAFRTARPESSNPRNLSLYERLGFERIGRSRQECHPN